MKKINAIVASEILAYVASPSGRFDERDTLRKGLEEYVPESKAWTAAERKEVEDALWTQYTTT
jgi:hypothetical protein